MKPQNFPEAVIWYYIIGTYILFFLGAQFIAAPVVAWLMVLYIFVKKVWMRPEIGDLEEKFIIPPTVWVWIISMSLMGLALVIGHANLDMGLTRIIKSFINFFLRTWALMAVFPLIGCLSIRPQLIYRAACILGLQSLILIPVAYGLGMANVEMPLYVVSLLAKVGGLGERYYAVSLYTIEAITDDRLRLTMNAPWAPALALAASVYFWLCYADSSRVWRTVGLISNAILIWGSVSRLGILCLFFIPVLRFFIIRLLKPRVQLFVGGAVFIASIFSSRIIRAAQGFKDYIDSQRAESSNLREILARMAFAKWREYPVWGHGILASEGPEYTYGMVIGSHHTWFGLLYTHGVVGLLAFLVPLTLSFLELLVKAQTSKLAQTALSIVLILIAFSIGENLETLIYLYWPGLVLLGIAFKEKLVLPASI